MFFHFLVDLGNRVVWSIYYIENLKIMITTTEIKYKSSKNYTLYESGQIKQDILPDGHVIEWYENGQIKSFIKKYGEKNIGDKEWFESGKIKREGDKEWFESGSIKREGDMEWYENGQLKYHQNKSWYEGGRNKRDGDKEWYENGQIKRDGGKYWCENGQIRLSGQFEWWENGKLKRNENTHWYENGHIKSDGKKGWYNAGEIKYSEYTSYWKNGQPRCEQLPNKISEWFEDGQRRLVVFRNIETKSQSELTVWYNTGEIRIKNNTEYYKNGEVKSVFSSVIKDEFFSKNCLDSEFNYLDDLTFFE